MLDFVHEFIRIIQTSFGHSKHVEDRVPQADAEGDRKRYEAQLYENEGALVSPGCGPAAPTTQCQLRNIRARNPIMDSRLCKRQRPADQSSLVGWPRVGAKLRGLVRLAQHVVDSDKLLASALEEIHRRASLFR